MTVSSLGVGSGILTSDLVDELVAAYREAGDIRLEEDAAIIEAEITAYAELTTYIETLESAVGALSTASTIQSTTASSSDDSVLTATTNTTADPGSYRIEVNQVATAHSLATQQYSSVDDTIGTGTLTINLGTTTYNGDGSYNSFTQNTDIATATIEITSENNTLSGIRDTINDADIGIVASVVFDGSGYRLLLTSEETGEDYSMEITVSGDAGLQSLAYNSAQNDASTNMEETQQGLDAELTVNGLDITSSSNAVDQVIQGVTLNVTETSDSAITLTVGRDLDDIAEKLEEFVASYNDYKAVYDALTALAESDEEGEELNGILLGDGTLRSINSQITSGVREIINGITDANFSSLAEIGITTDQNDDFKLVFDRTAFEDAMASNAENVSALLAEESTATDSQVDVILVGTDTVPGTYDVNITQVATQAVYTGLSSSALDFASNVEITDVNDEFTLTLNGDTSTVTLTQGEYSSGEDLALMIQNAINAAFSSQSATVAFDDDNDAFTITSSEYGSESQVIMGSGDALIAETLGFAVAGSGEYVGSYFSTLDDASFGASTSPGSQAFAEEDDANFSINTVTFDLTLTGTTADGTYAISLDEDWSDVVDTDGTVVTDRDREDVLAYIQSELDDAGLSGIVVAEFNDSDRLVFRTEPDAGTQTITIANTTVSGTDLLGITDGSSSSGVTISDTDFELSYTNSYGTVASAASIVVPDGTYETAADLAAAIETAINADANIAAATQGAMTEAGTTDLSSAIDFTTDAAQLVIDYNGTEYTIEVNANGADNLDSIQQAIDAELGAGVITASLDNDGLVLTTDATGSSESLTIVKDGSGATTDVGSVDLSAGVDFSATPATFTLVVDGIDIDVTVDGDGTASSNLEVIQSALDTALTSANGGGEFAAGDVVAQLDSSGQLYFETVSKNGVATETTFGADASIQISTADANANAVLGITAGVTNSNGYDAFGMDLGTYTGFDSQSTVSYEQDENGDGRFVISFGNTTDITLSNISLNASVQLGFSETNQVDTEENYGLDVEGTINGVEAIGEGQYLTASQGNDAATNGYLLGGTAWDFTSAAVLDGTNNTLKVEIDGIESGTITLTAGAYTTGEALAAELEAQINADSLLIAADKSVDVQYDETTGIFGIFSTTRGSESTVSVTEITTGGIDIFGLTTSTSGVTGEDASGDIDDAAGLILEITGTRTGDRGSVTYVQGIMSQLDDLFANMLSSTGLITEKENNLLEEQERLEAEMDLFDDRVAAYEERLRSSFLYYDIVIANYQSTQDYLVQQFEAMNASNDS